eukprot:evm.model.scf_1102.2 EVM.evm.TU.scf_1102.2   scf_1102:20541-21936(-)
MGNPEGHRQEGAMGGGPLAARQLSCGADGKRMNARSSGAGLEFKIRALERGGARTYALLAATIDDVEQKRHRRNPFDEKYLRLCLLAIDETIIPDEEKVNCRDVVESAATSVRVRVEVRKILDANRHP